MTHQSSGKFREVITEKIEERYNHSGTSDFFYNDYKIKLLTEISFKKNIILG